MVGALIAAGLLLALLGVALQHAAGTEGQVVASYGYWYVDPTAKIADTIILAPSMLAVAITKNPLLILMIGIGFTLNSFQIVCNCYIGVTRIMVAMSLDRLLPAWVSKVHERFHTPVNAHLVYFLFSIPIFALYSFKYGEFILFTLGVTFGCGYVFAATALSGAFLPNRAKALYDASPGSRYNINIATIDEVDKLITDAQIDQSTLEFLASHSVEILSTTPNTTLNSMERWINNEGSSTRCNHWRRNCRS